MLGTDIKHRIDSIRGMLRRNPGERLVTEELIQAHADEVAAEASETVRHTHANIEATLPT